MALTQDVQSVVLTLMEGLDSARSLTVAILVRYGEWDQITQLETDPSHFCDADSYLSWAAPTDLLRKFDGFTLPIDKEQDTFKKWLDAEQECSKTNRRLDTYLDSGPFGGYDGDERIAEFFRDARKMFEFLVGSHPPTSYDGRFGPGATVSDSSRYTTVPDKLSSTPTLTSDALWFLVPWTGTHWATACADLKNDISFVRGNTYFQVPKHSRINRSCAKEPSINGYYQLGLGRVMRTRLKQRGFDLTEGQDVHRQVACTASRSGDLVTIDLSSASDCVSTNLVKLLAPRGWHNHLAALRSPFTKVGKTWYKLEKFSSMGNGFTFELETTIFASLCLAIDPGLTPGVDLFVYGDDIIVPKRIAQDVIWALRFCGFTTNARKTFVEGYFRESCGGDFFDGQAVRPYHLEEDPNEPQKLIAFANGLRRLASQNGWSPRRSSSILRAWFRCLDLLPAPIRRCRGPQGLGDICIHDDESRWQIRWRSSIRYVRVYRPVITKRVMWERFAYSVQFAAALYGVSPNDKSIGEWYRRERWIAPRDAVGSYKVGWVASS